MTDPRCRIELLDPETGRGRLLCTEIAEDVEIPCGAYWSQYYGRYIKPGDPRWNQITFEKEALSERPLTREEVSIIKAGRCIVVDQEVIIS